MFKWKGKVRSKKGLKRLAKEAAAFHADGTFLKVINRIPTRFEKTAEYAYLLMLADFFRVTTLDGKNTLQVCEKLSVFRKSKKCKQYMRPVLVYCILACLVRASATTDVGKELEVVRKKMRANLHQLPKQLRKEARKNMCVAS